MPRLIPILDAQGNYSNTVDLESLRCVWESFILNAALYPLPDGLWLLTEVSFQSIPPLTTGQAVKREQAINWLVAAHEVPPDELLRDGESVDAALALNNLSYRCLWEFARRVEKALERVLCAGCNLCCEELRLEWDADAPAIGAAAAELDAVIRVISDVGDWINTPHGADELVNTLFAIQAETRSLIIKVGHSVRPLNWNGDLKKLSLLQDFLAREIADVASIPDLERELYAEALRKVQVASPSVVQNIERRIEPDGTVSDTPTALPACAALDAGAVKAASAAATEALPVNAVAVESAPESKATVDAADKRLWTKTAAQPIVYAYLQKHPYTTAKAIEAETGIPDSTVCKTQAWKRRRFKRPNGKRNAQAKRGALSLTEKVIAMAEKVAGPDVDIEGLIRRCEAEPDFRQTLEDAYEASMAEGAAQQQGRRPVA